MKRLLLSILLVAMVSSAQAEEAQEMTPLQFCHNIGQMANSIMHRRQSEESMTSVMLIVDEVEGSAEGLKELVHDMIKQAYKIPIQTSIPRKKRTRLNFRDLQEQQCLSSLNFKFNQKASE